jgi:D-beta-D-heptose 7-phosphate kinase/D-beta-D-heptose 1-phosphate adenosyltransferase
MGRLIAVIGDLMLDHFLFGNCNRISPEAPVPIVSVDSEKTTLGGAGNVAKNLIALGANVDVYSVIGDDDAATTIVNQFQDIGVNVDNVFVDKNRKTSKKSRILAQGQQLIRVDRETKFPISNSYENKLTENFKEYCSKYDAVCISDYDKGVVNNDFCLKIIEISNLNNVNTFIDPIGLDYSKYKGAFLLKPNKKEALEAAGKNSYAQYSISEIGLHLMSENYVKNLIITLSQDGLIIFEENKITHIPTEVKEVYDVTGAGDTVLATLAFFMSNGVDIVEASRLANYAAAIVIGKVGSATASIDEINELINGE